MSEAQSIPLRVQVIDMKSVTLNLVVPTYLPARDLTQRVARDAGLNAYWPDGRRRRYWIRARGRVVGDDERLSDVGVIAGELVHLLPEPPPGSGVVEQDPDYPETHDYPAGGNLAIIGGIATVLFWSIGWGLALSTQPGLPAVLLPGLGLGLLCCSLGRHLIGGQGGRLIIAALGALLVLFMLVPAGLIPILSGLPVPEVLTRLLPGGLTALFGVVMGWLAWWGPVEPLPPRVAITATSAELVAAQVVPCAICGQGATAEVRVACPYQCGREFHQGCYRARVAVAQTQANLCVICGTRVGG